LDTLLRFSRIPLEARQDPARVRPADVPVMVSDCTRLRERAGWRTTIPFEQSVGDVLDYWRIQVKEKT
jgi:GDP-4-dehydro-6-deoxy-D-mannose reductase